MHFGKLRGQKFPPYIEGCSKQDQRANAQHADFDALIDSRARLLHLWQHLHARNSQGESPTMNIR